MCIKDEDWHNRKCDQEAADGAGDQPGTAVQRALFGGYPQPDRGREPGYGSDPGAQGFEPAGILSG